MRAWLRSVRRFSWLLPCVLLILWAPRGVHAGNPDLRWRTLETEHFYVHYYVGEEVVAERMAMVAERAYENLSVAWGHTPHLKTHIVAIDTTDVANGRATAIPYPRMTVHVTAPAALSTLAAYDDWVDILITHELVHVLHLGTVHGIPRMVNAVLGFGVLGKVMAPNIVQPRWIIEGVATYEESDDSTGGRGRSAQFDMFLRMAILEGMFQEIDQASSGAKIWPHGTTVYLYGLHFMQYIAARYGHDKLRELSHIYGGQAIPFGINRAIEKVLGTDFYQLWNEFERHMELRFQSQARRIRAHGLRQGRRLTYSGETTRYPVWSKDDRYLYFYGDTKHAQGGIKRIPRTGGRIREGIGFGREGNTLDAKMVVQVEDAGAADFIGDSDDLVLDMLGFHDLRYRWSDLYRWDGGDPRNFEQLTFGLRASEPNVSPDGRTVVFRRNDTGESRLGFLDLRTGEVEQVETPKPLSQVFTPRWSPDGSKVAYSGWQEGGFRDIYVYHRETGRIDRITADRHMDISPTWSPDGRYLLFSSDRNQVFNIYALELETDELFQVSNVLGGAFEPAVSHDGKTIAYVGYSANGYDLWAMELDRSQWSPVMTLQANNPPAHDPTPEIEADIEEGDRYRAIETFYPRTIFPTALDFQASSFGTELGFEMGIVDVLGFHSLTGRFAYLLPPINEPVGNVTYVYDRLFPTLFTGFARGFALRRGFVRYDYDHGDLPENLSGSYRVEGYRERVTRWNAGLRLPLLRHPRHRVSTAAEYRFTRYTNLDEDAPVDPNAPVATLPEVGDVTQVDLDITYSNQEGTRFGYRAESGRRISLSLTVIDELLGGDYGDLQMRGSVEQMLQMPWRGHQVLALRASGGASAGGLRRRGAFFIGGFPGDQDVFRSLLARRPFGTGGNLRGYPRGRLAGRYFALMNTEYRIPVFDVYRGIGTVPAFLQRIVAIPYTDVGNAWSEKMTFEDLKWSVGGSLVFSFRVGYLETIDLFLDYAHGFDDELGRDVFRAIVARSF